MKDFELIVYIIAALIYFISKNYRKVQQNRPGQQSDPSPFNESPEPAPIPGKKKKEVSEVSLPRKKPSYNKIPYRAMEREGLAKNYKPVRKTQMPDFLKTEIESTQNYFQNLMATEESYLPVQLNEPEDIKPYLLPEDLKKAIIYAEIIKRPYQ